MGSARVKSNERNEQEKEKERSELEREREREREIRREKEREREMKEKATGCDRRIETRRVIHKTRKGNWTTARIELHLKVHS